MERADVDSKEKLEKAISAEEAWVDSQKWNFLVDVNI